MKIIDVSNPTQPTQVGLYTLEFPDPIRPWNLTWYASGLAIVAPYAYVVGGSYSNDPFEPYGLQVIDISDSNNPKLTYIMENEKQNSSWAGYAIALQDQLAFIAAGDNGLRVIDLSNRVKPVEIGSLKLPGRTHTVAVQGSFAYLTSEDNGLHIVNISDPTKPIRESTFKTHGVMRDAIVKNQFAYVAADGAGLRIVDISNPKQPHEVAYYNTRGRTFGVTVTDDYIYLADDQGGLFILDFKIPKGTPMP